MNDCEKYEELCSAALDNALTAHEKEELDAHLAVCPSCREYLEDLKEMRALWKELEVPVPKDLHEKMMGAIEAEVAKTIVQMPQKERGRPPVFTMLAAAAACVMLAVSGELTGLFGQMSVVPIQGTDKREVPSAADAAIPQTTLQKPAQNEQKSEQPEVKKPEPEPEIVEQQAKPDEAKKPKEKQTEQPEIKPVPKETEEMPPENVPQVANEAPVAVEGEAPPENPSGKMVREVEPPVAVAYAAPGLPEELGQMQFARCYDVTGGTELPVLDDMTLLVTADGISYYSVENNESKIGQVQQELKKSGYTLTLNEASGVSIQRSAKTILLIVHIG